MGEKPSLAFGKRIRQIRIDRGLSQRELAAKVGIDFTYLSKIENNRAAPPRDDVIKRIAEILDTDLEELCRFSGNGARSFSKNGATPARDAILTVCRLLCKSYQSIRPLQGSV